MTEKRAAGDPRTPAKEPSPHEEVAHEAPLDATQVRRLASSGAVLIVLRGTALQAFSFGANIVLARLLVPHDFGLVALGNSILEFGSLMATGGASQALIRQEHPPSIAALRAIVGFQLVVTTAVAVVVAVSVIPIGSGGRLAAVMALSLPLLAFRSPAAVMLERSLSYRALVTAEIAENVVYYTWALATVSAGWGVWGLATAVLVRTLAGTALLIAIGPVRLLWPSWSWSQVRPIITQGAKFQAISVANLVRDQMLNVAIAAISGLSVLGLWSLAARALSVPTILLEALWRVSYPAMSRLITLEEDIRVIVERSVGMVATVGGLALCPVAASAPALIPAVFGARWAGAADALPAACVGLMIAGPISVASGGYLAASGRAGTVLRGAVWHTVAQFAVALPLLPVLHLWGVGLGLLASSVVEALILGRRTAQATHAKMLRPLMSPLVASCVAGSLGWLFANAQGPGLSVGILAGVAAAAIYALLMLATPGNLLLQTLGQVRTAMAAAR